MEQATHFVTLVGAMGIGGAVGAFLVLGGARFLRWLKRRTT